METDNRCIDLVSLPKKSFWKITLPIMGFVFFNAIYGIIDMYWVSLLDSQSFYVVSVCVPIFTLICAIGDSIGQGTNSLMSRSIGSENYRNAYNTILHGILVCIVLWIITMLFIPFIYDILIFSQINNEIYEIRKYLAPIMLFSIFFFLPNFFSETLQAEGDSVKPTMIIILCNILNLILDPILIFVLDWGLTGAAYATIISSLISTLALVYLYFSKRTKVPISLKYFKFEPHILIQIFNVAVPNFFSDAILCFVSVFINALLLREIGQIGILLYSTSIKLQSLFITPIRAYGRGLMSVIGHLFGARDFEAMRKLFRYVLKISLVTILVISLFFVIFRDIIYYTFSISGMEVAVANIALYGTLILVGVTVLMIISKMLDAFGKSYYSLAFTIIEFVLQIIFILVLDQYTTGGVSVLMGIALSVIVVVILYSVFLRYIFNRMERQNLESNLNVI